MDSIWQGYAAGATEGGCYWKPKLCEHDKARTLAEVKLVVTSSREDLGTVQDFSDAFMR